MRPAVYLDSTIPSYWLDPESQDPVYLARHLSTRRWWQTIHGYRVFISQVVIDELQEGRADRATQRLELVQEIQLLDINPDCSQAAKFYAQHFAMPGKNVRDALHLALASFYRIDYLLTWNLAHLANARKRRHIEALNMILGFATPIICTPEELLADVGPEVL